LVKHISLGERMSKFTLEQLNDLTEAISKGVKRIKYEDKDLTFQSIDEMLKLKIEMEIDLGLKKRGQKLLAEFDKGLC